MMMLVSVDDEKGDDDDRTVVEYHNDNLMLLHRVMRVMSHGGGVQNDYGYCHQNDHDDVFFLMIIINNHK